MSSAGFSQHQGEDANKAEAKSGTRFRLEFVIGLLPFPPGAIKAGDLVVQGYIADGVVMAFSTVAVCVILLAGCAVMTRILALGDRG